MKPSVTAASGPDWGAIVQPREHARERAVAGWIRIACFLSILLHHTLLVPYDFLDGRALVVWVDTLRDFGVVGFFLIAGASLRAKVNAQPRTRFGSSVLMKVGLSALGLTLFEAGWAMLRGAEPGPFQATLYREVYESNLWFLLAYGFAGPMLLALDERAAARTFVCALLLVLFPAYVIQSSPYILHSIGLAFVCMYVGYRTYGWQVRPWIAATAALACFLARIALDDYGTPAYPAWDMAFRLVYGLAVFHLLKALADRIVPRAPAPRFANYLFVPYVIQYPLIMVMVQVAKVMTTAIFGSAPLLVFGEFADALVYMLLVFALCAATSFAIASLLRHHDIRL